MAVLYASISVLNLREPVQGDKERCDVGSFELV